MHNTRCGKREVSQFLQKIAYIAGILDLKLDYWNKEMSTITILAYFNKFLYNSIIWNIFTALAVR